MTLKSKLVWLKSWPNNIAYNRTIDDKASEESKLEFGVKKEDQDANYESYNN